MDRLASIPERDFRLHDVKRQRNERQYEYRESFQSLKGIKNKGCQMFQPCSAPFSIVEEKSIF